MFSNNCKIENCNSCIFHEYVIKITKDDEYNRKMNIVMKDSKENVGINDTTENKDDKVDPELKKDKENVGINDTAENKDDKVDPELKKDGTV